MARQQRDVVEQVEGLPPITGAHGAAALELEQMMSPRTRLQWYLVGGAVGVLGGFGALLAYRITGAPFNVIPGFALLLVAGGGFGPSALAGVGSFVLANLLLPTSVFPPTSAGAAFRLVSILGVLVFGSVLAGRLRRSRLSEKEREASLERAAASVRELLDHNSDAIMLADDALRIQYANPRFEAMFGFASGKAIGVSIPSLIEPKSLRDTPMPMEALRSGNIVRTERPVVRTDGTVFLVEIMSRIVSGGRLLASLRDVTEQRREAEQQRAERDLLNGILATSVAGIVAVDTNEEIIFANRRAEELLELTKTNPDSLVYDRPLWRQAKLESNEWSRDSRPFAKVVSTGKSMYDMRLAIVWPDGRRISLSVNGSPLRDAEGTLDGVVFAVNDISAALEAERALRERDRQLQQITDAMPGIVYQYVMDAEGQDRLVFVSRFSERLLGRSADQLRSSVDSAWSLIHPEDVQATRRSLLRSFRGMTPWYHEFRIQDVQASGRWRWVRGHAIPQPGPQPGSVLWNGILIDVTDRKSLEDDLRQAQRIESVGRLAGGVAHDFNNLLTVILGQTEMLAMELPSHSSAAEGVRQIRSAAQSGSALTRQLLGFARKQMVEPRVIDVNSLVERVPPLVGRLLGRTISLDLQLAKVAPRVHVDPAQFDQVLVNLVVNACDAMPDGGHLEIQTREISADEALSKPEYATIPGPLAEIRVRDTGIGMPADVRGRAFEPFFTTKGLGKGTGLGLATSHGIVSQAGGTIIIDSVVGQGTTVRVLLPVTQETTSLPDESTSTVASEGGNETVLVVDDNDAVRGITATALRRKGYRVLQAESGATAIDASRKEQGTIHLLVTDVAMPHMSGPVLADQLTRERPDMRVLFVTGYADGAIAQYGVPIEGAALLQKPYDIGSLARRVRELLEEEPRAAT